MKFFSSLKSVLLGLAIAGAVNACHKSSDNQTIKVGTIAGPESELMYTAAHVAHDKYGLDVKVIEFSDYALPNSALNDGSIDANMFQHKPYLEATIASRHFPLVIVGTTFIYPMGIYSAKLKELHLLPKHALVAIPNDPSNSARALLLLQKAGLISLKSNDANVTVRDVVSNPQELQIKELDAAQLPRTLPDVDIAVINSNYAVPAGLFPFRDALFIESKDSNYANLLCDTTR